MIFFDCLFARMPPPNPETQYGQLLAEENGLADVQGMRIERIAYPMQDLLHAL